MAIIGVGASAIGAVAVFLKLRKGKGSSLEERSTTSSAGGGAAAYETRKAVDEYIQFHFGAEADVLPYGNGPKASPFPMPAMHPQARVQDRPVDSFLVNLFLPSRHFGMPPFS